MMDRESSVVMRILVIRKLKSLLIVFVMWKEHCHRVRIRISILLLIKWEVVEWVWMKRNRVLMKMVRVRKLTDCLFATQVCFLVMLVLIIWLLFNHFLIVSQIELLIILARVLNYHKFVDFYFEICIWLYSYM